MEEREKTFGVPLGSVGLQRRGGISLVKSEALTLSRCERSEHACDFFKSLRVKRAYV